MVSKLSKIKLFTWIRVAEENFKNATIKHFSLKCAKKSVRAENGISIKCERIDYQGNSLSLSFIRKIKSSEKIITYTLFAIDFNFLLTNGNIIYFLLILIDNFWFLETPTKSWNLIDLRIHGNPIRLRSPDFFLPKMETCNLRIYSSQI